MIEVCSIVYRVSMQRGDYLHKKAFCKV